MLMQVFVTQFSFCFCELGSLNIKVSISIKPGQSDLVKEYFNNILIA